MGSKSSSSTIVGYWYYMAGIFGVCLKATKLLKIIYGERVAWEGEATPNSTIYINAKSLYGGDSTGGSGGIQGNLYFNGGDADQGRNTVVSTFLGNTAPALRGLVTVSLMGTTTNTSSYKSGAVVSAYSATFRQIYLKVQNLGYDWYSAKATIADTEINPAHEIRDALINPALAGQYSVDDLDEDSFMAAADTLYDENFGLSPLWSDTSQAQEYIQDLLTHIDGVLVRDRATGKFKLKLNRADYDIDDLVTLTKADFTEISSLGSLALTSTINKITLQYARITDVGEETGTITAENQANVAMQDGYVSSTTLTFNHVTDAIEDLPGRILARELHARSYPLKSFTMKGASAAITSLQEGDVFILSYPEEGIDKLVSRVLDIDYGTADSHIVTVSCTEDIYGTPLTSIVSSTGSQWESSFTDPVKPAVFEMVESPLYIVLSQTDFDLTSYTQYPKAGHILTVAAKYNALDTFYTHNIYEDDTWKSKGDGHFVESSYILAIGKKDTVLSTYDISESELSVGDLIFLNDEIMSVVSFTTDSITVLRGVLDTLPQEHAAGSRVWLSQDGDGGICTQMYVEGQTAQIALSTTNSIGTSTPIQADLIATNIKARAYRPYPPANLSLNDAYLPDKFEGELTISWQHRDRFLQLDVIVGQDAGDIGPEDGTTYTLKLYGENGSLVRTVEGIEDNFYVWATEQADSGLAVWDTTLLIGDAMPKRYNSNVTVELCSVRDGYASWQSWIHEAARTLPVANAPTITGISDGETGVALQPVISIAAFSSSGEIPASVNNFRIRWTVGLGDTIYEEFHTLSASGGTITATTALPEGSSIVAEFTWAGNIGGAGASTVIGFETLAPVINNESS